MATVLFLYLFLEVKEWTSSPAIISVDTPSYPRVATKKIESVGYSKGRTADQDKRKTIVASDVVCVLEQSRSILEEKKGKSGVKIRTGFLNAIHSSGQLINQPSSIPIQRRVPHYIIS